jgi:predicted transcriptional regulator
MDILYRRERAHAGDVQKELSGDTSYSAVRAQLRVLEEKGHVLHEEKDLRYVYFAAIPRNEVRHSALRHLMDTFFEGSTENVLSALIGGEKAKVSKEELDRLAQMIDKARKGHKR